MGGAASEGCGGRGQVVPRPLPAQSAGHCVPLVPVGAGCQGGHVPRPGLRAAASPAGSHQGLAGAGEAELPSTPAPPPQVAAEAPSPRLGSQEIGLLALLRCLGLEGPASQQGEAQRPGGATWAGEETTERRGNQRLQNHVVPLTLPTFSLDSRPQQPHIG